jgi:hypothetical protein
MPRLPRRLTMMLPLASSLMRPLAGMASTFPTSLRCARVLRRSGAKKKTRKHPQRLQQTMPLPKLPENAGRWLLMLLRQERTLLPPPGRLKRLQTHPYLRVRQLQPVH